MKSCKNVRDLFEEYLFDELDDEETEAMGKHLKKCDTCRSLFEEEKSLRELTGKAVRPEPAPEFWDEYWMKLKDRMEREDILIREMPESEEEKKHILQWMPRWVMQGAAALVLITVGVIIGKMMFSPSDGSRRDRMLTGISAGTPDNLELADYTLDYIDQSRVMLLAVMNHDFRNEDPQALNLDYQQRKSRELVVRAGFIKKNLDESRQRRLYELIEDLELILMQIANLDADADETDIQLIQEGVDSRGILFKIRMSEMRQSMDRDKIKSEKI